MTISDFNAWSALAGGVLIGAGAVALMLSNGRIMGIAGILGGLVGEPSSSDNRWRLAFVAGMALPSAVAGLGGTLVSHPSGLAIPGLLIAGFLVGLGSRMGNGCTSGHGICGLARFSRRSIAAVLTFMGVCALTVFVARHLIGG